MKRGQGPVELPELVIGRAGVVREQGFQMDVVAALDPGQGFLEGAGGFFEVPAILADQAVAPVDDAQVVEVGADQGRDRPRARSRASPSVRAWAALSNSPSSV